MALLMKRLTRKSRRPLGMCFLDGDDDGGGGAGGGSSWRDSLPDDLRSHPSLTDFNDVPSLAKSFISTQSMIGMDKVVIPKDPQDPAWSEVYNKLGRPESPEGYELKRPDGYPEGLDFNDDYANAMSKAAYEAGISKSQLAKLVDASTGFYKDKVSEMAVTQQNAFNESINNLKSNWGAAFDQNLNIAKNAVKAYATPELVEFLETTGLGNDARVIQLFHNIGKTISEDSALEGGGSSMIPTADQAKQQIADLKGDKEFMAAYLDKNNIGHKEALIRMTNLFKLAYPPAPGEQK